MGPCPFPIVSQFVQIISICRQTVLSWPQPSGISMYVSEFSWPQKNHLHCENCAALGATQESPNFA